MIPDPLDCCMCQVLEPTDMAALAVEWDKKMILLGRSEPTDCSPANDNSPLEPVEYADCPF